jgi:hypothetical protein
MEVIDDLVLLYVWNIDLLASRNMVSRGVGSLRMSSRVGVGGS